VPTAVALGLALALAVALGGTEDAAEIVTAAFALTLALGDAVAEAEALLSDVCASEAGANSIMAASIVAADNESFLLNSILVPPCFICALLLLLCASGTSLPRRSAVGQPSYLLTKGP